jgi:DNA-directed RNA polymerase III subunit RPC8
VVRATTCHSHSLTHCPPAPSPLHTRTPKALTQEVDRKYSNKIIQDFGLCICLWDFESVGEGYIYPCDGHAHTQASFRLLMFRPFVGEVITGKIMKADREGMKVQIEFFDDIWIPAYNMPHPSVFDEAEQVWVWKHESGDKFYMDMYEEIRFRVTHLNFTRVTTTVRGLMATTTGTQLTKEVDDERPTPRQRSSSVDLTSTEAPRPSTLQLIGTLDDTGLGLLSWWQAGEEEEAPEEGAEAPEGAEGEAAPAVEGEEE